MKTWTNVFKCCDLIVIGITVLIICYSCTTDDDSLPASNNISAEMSDSLANHFGFLDAKKITGTIPTISNGNRVLKFNVHDTLHISAGAFFPMKFLHDSSTDVTGVYIQVQVFSGVIGGPINSSYYYDVPEVPDMDSDTVSVVLVPFNPTTEGSLDFDLPLSFNIKIVPHSDKGLPLDQGTVPIVIDKLDNDATNPICGLTEGYWKWICSTTPGEFYNDPDKIWGRKGQTILGSCCDDVSVYGICPGLSLPNKSLQFSTYSQYVEEDLTFYENGTFFRQTIQNYAVPDPERSDFCAKGEGVLTEGLLSITYQGNWAVDEIPMPERMQHLGFPGTFSRVILNQTTSSNFGYGNPGGVISQLTCSYLVLTQLDPEGFGQDLWKFYERKSNFQNTEEDDWYDIPE